MAGFYIHIPFCKKVCYYCDFHFVATLKYKDQMVDAMLKEIELRSKSWNKEEFQTLYFGGGTPSVLSVDEINRLVTKIYKNYKFSSKIEFTLEANPDDLTPEYLKSLKENTTVNRLSIGTQSFRDVDLKTMNRRHSGEEAYTSIKNAQDKGFTNLNIDLIYGLPGLTDVAWEDNIAKFLELEAPHLSAYHLSFEPKTVFDHLRKKNKLHPVKDDISQSHYKTLISSLKRNGFQHYEISNFAKDDYYSNHNTNYWLGASYIGIGPSAHSYDGTQRSWNVSNNTKYCKDILAEKDSFYTTEELSISDRYNEYILTSLRTHWGVNVGLIGQRFGENYSSHLRDTIQRFSEGEHYEKTDIGFKLSEKGWLIADFILRELFYMK